MPEIISLKNLSFNYGQTEILKDISLTVESGDFIGLAGPNGAGKTTLIKVILGLLPMTKGEVELFATRQEKFSDWKKLVICLKN